MKKDEKPYLLHIVEASDRVLEYVACCKEKFFNDYMVQDATVKVLANIAESAGNVSDETKKQYTEIDWGLVKSFRNFLMHDYLGDVDYAVIWKIIHEDLPDLVKVAKRILKEKYGV